MPAHHLLGQFKQYQTHFAFVVDEYGTTAGIVSLRDLLDRIAGEMRDKSEAEPQQIQWLPDGSALVDGLVLLSDVAEELRIPLSDPDYDTGGGVAQKSAKESWHHVWCAMAQWDRRRPPIGRVRPHRPGGQTRTRRVGP